MSETKDPQPPLDDLVQSTPAPRPAVAPDQPSPADAAPLKASPLEIPPDAGGPVALAPLPAAPPPPSTMDTLEALATSDQDPDPLLPPPPVVQPRSTMGDLDRLLRQDEAFDDPNSPAEERQPRSTMDVPAAEDGERIKLRRSAERDAPPSPLESLVLLDALLAQLRMQRAADLDAEQLRAVAELVVQGARIPLRARETQAPPASPLEALGELRLPPRARADDADTPAGAEGSSLDGLLSNIQAVRLDAGRSDGEEPTSSMGDLFAALGRAEDRVRQRAEAESEPSGLEELLAVVAAMRAARGDDDEAAPSSMEGLLSQKRDGGGQASRVQRLRSSLSEALRMAAAGRLEVLPERRTQRHTMADDMSKLLAQQEPRLQLPRRKARHHQPVKPDGFTPIPPEERELQTQLAAGQGCPKRGVVPVPAGELVHERLDFRYNRFERLVVRQTQFECPGCADVPLFVGQDPTFISTQAPLGDGLLAQLVVATYLDRLPLQRFAALLADLGAAIPQRALTDELEAVAVLLRPVFGEMLREASQEEPPLPALVRDRERDTPGQVRVQRSKAGMVCLQFSATEALPRSPVEALAGPRALTRQRGQGRAGRWADVRQRFFLALLTSPEQARRGLALLDRLGPAPHPSHREAELKQLHGWLKEQAAAFSAPRNRLEYAVTATLALWPQLTASDEAPRRRLIEAPWTLAGSAPGPEAELLWQSLIESCVALELPPWTYLHALLRARANDTRFDPRAWTPEARARQG